MQASTFDNILRLIAVCWYVVHEDILIDLATYIYPSSMCIYTYTQNLRVTCGKCEYVVCRHAARVLVCIVCWHVTSVRAHMCVACWHVAGVRVRVAS